MSVKSFITLAPGCHCYNTFYGHDSQSSG